MFLGRVADIENNMDINQTANPRSSLIRIHILCFHEKTGLRRTCIYADDVKSRQNSQEKNCGRIRVKKSALPSYPSSTLGIVISQPSVFFFYYMNISCDG